MKKTVVVIAGPTASGKTALGVRLAKKLDGEIISADSMQIYKEMDIATAKPTEEEKEGIPHYLIDFVEPNESFSVAKYSELANAAIEDILSRGKLPIIVGGTGLYIDAVVNNTKFIDCGESDIRSRLQKKLELEGAEKLLSELSAVDKETAEKLHPNDSKRIIRALEMYYTTGKTMTQQRELSHLDESEYNFCMIVLGCDDRQYLYERIEKRVDRMMQQGLLEEARRFFEKPYSATSKQAIGYKELKPYFDGELTLDEALQKLKTETRRYAKRQLTWFRHREYYAKLKIDTLGEDVLFDEALRLIGEFNKGEKE